MSGETIKFNSTLVDCEGLKYIGSNMDCIRDERELYGDLSCEIEKPDVNVGDEFIMAGATFVVKTSRQRAGMSIVTAAGKTKGDFNLALYNLGVA